MSDVVDEFPIFAFTLQVPATPMHIGARLLWLMLHGTTIRPRAISSQTNSGSSRSRPATYRIWSVMIPFRARWICVGMGSFADASRFIFHTPEFASFFRFD